MRKLSNAEGMAVLVVAFMFAVGVCFAAIMATSGDADGQTCYESDALKIGVDPYQQPSLEPNKYQPNWDAERIEIASEIMASMVGGSKSYLNDSGKEIRKGEEYAASAVEFTDDLIAELKKRQ